MLTDSNVIIWQVGCVGEFNFSFKGYTKKFLGVLINKLQQVYGRDYEIIHYIGAHYPIYEPVTECLLLSDFLKPEVAKKVTSISTFFIPPKEVHPVKKEVCKLLQITVDKSSTQPQPMPTKDKSHTYAKDERDAISQLGHSKVPRHYVHLQPTMTARYLARMSTDPKALEMHTEDPIASMNRFGLSSHESQLIKNKQAYAAVKPCTDTTDKAFDDSTVVVVVVAAEESKESLIRKNPDIVCDDTTVVVVIVGAEDLKESVIPGTIAYV